MTEARNPLYRRHCFPAEVIAEAVWLYFRFPFSLRMVDDMLAYKGIIVDVDGNRILNREGPAETKFVFSAKEDKEEKPPGLITVSGSLEEVDAGGNKVWNDYSREYPLNYGQALDFEFPKLPPQALPP